MAIYLTAGLGPGPRDGIMTAMTQRGYSVRLVRTVKEVTVLVIGAALGGAFGIGTLIYALTIGHGVHFLSSSVATEAGCCHPDTRRCMSHDLASEMCKRAARKSGSFVGI